MRKIRVNIFDDDPAILKLFATIMSSRNYEVFAYDRAVLCPVYRAEDERCSSLKPCADIILTDNRMPGTTGIDMLLQQALRGCKVDTRNIAVASADLDYNQQKILQELGCVFLEKPFRLGEIVAWLEGCERRIDLSMPLGIIRNGARYPSNIEMEWATEVGEKIFKGIAMNYGVNGLCLKTDALLGEGQAIVIRSELPNGRRRGTVCWVEQLGSGDCRAGISCL